MCIKHGSTISRTLLHTEHSMYLYKIVRHAADMHIMPSMFARVIHDQCYPCYVVLTSWRAWHTQAYLTAKKAYLGLESIKCQILPTGYPKA